MDRLQSFLRSASGGTRRPVYVLKLDIANCFNSIHRPTLFRFVQQRLVRAVRRQGLARDEARALQSHCRALLSAEPAAGVRRLGVDFLGYVVWPAHRVPRRRVVRHFHARLAAYERAHVGRSGLRLPPRARDRLRAQVASFRAHCRHASAAGVWQRTLERFPWLRAMFDHPEDGSLAQSLRPRWNATSVSGLAGQYRALARRHLDACLLLEVGNRWLWPDSVARAAGQGGCGTAVLRPGLGRCREIAAAELPALCRRLRRAGQAYVLAAQTGHFRTGFRRREIVECWYPPAAAAAQALFSSTPRGER